MAVKHKSRMSVDELTVELQRLRNRVDVLAVTVFVAFCMSIFAACFAFCR